MHKVSCFGYVVIEKAQSGNLIIKKAQALGIDPGPDCDLLKRGHSVVSKTGITVHSKDVVMPPRPGRKVVFLGDTCNPSRLGKLAMNADVLIHEATFDHQLKSKAIERGHSTAGMAGSFAKQINAKTLIINHFSPRYRVHDQEIDPGTSKISVLLIGIS